MALSYALSTYPYFSAWYDSEVDPLLAEEAIDGATGAIEAALGNVAFVRRTITAERQTGGYAGKRGGAKNLRLDWGPIASVSTIVDDQTTPATVAATDYEVERWCLEHHNVWPMPFYRWNITYVAGDYADVTAVPEHIRTACHRMAAHILKAPKGPITSESRGDASTSFESASSFVTTHGRLPADVLQLVMQYRRIGLV